MTAGAYISGGGHTALILGLLFGGWFTGDPPLAPETADVSVITSEQFAALSAPENAPVTQVDIPTPATPEVEDSAVPAPRPQAPPTETDAPEVEPPTDPDALPEVPDQPTPPDPELTEDVPDLVVPEPPAPDVPIIAPESDTPQVQEAPRVAPSPVPESPLSPEIADTATPRVSPDAETPMQAEDLPEAAPEEATTEIVTEAETPASAAPSISARPTARPVRQAVVEPKPATPAAATSTDDAVAAAIANDVTEQPAAEPARPNVPVGPPLTGSEKEGLRVAVQQCWNTGSLSTEALRVTVVVGVSLAKDGKPNVGSITMLDYFDGDDAAARKAYEAARRAIIRCGTNGYKLPVEKYEQWRDIEMTFNPERMRIK